MKKPGQIKISNFFFDFIKNENNVLLKSLNFVLLFLILFFIIIFQPPTTYLNLRIGDVVKKDIVANNDIKYIDEETTIRREELIKVTTPPLFIFNTDIPHNRYKMISSFFEQMLEDKGLEEIKTNLQEIYLTITEDEYQIIISILKREPNFVENFLYIFANIYNEGIIELNYDNLTNLELSGVVISKYENGKSINTLYSIDEVYNKDTVNPIIENKIEDIFKNYRKSHKELLFKLYNDFTVPNILYNKEISELRLKNRLKTEAKSYKTIKKGQMLLRKGDVIKQDNIELINSFLTNKKDFVNIYNIISVLIFVLSILIFLYYFIYHVEPSIFSEIKNHIFISIILIIYFLYLSLPIYLGYDKSHIYYGFYLPISSFCILFFFLYSRTVSAFFAILLAIIFYYISGFNNFSFLFILASGISSVFIISIINRRLDLMISGIKISFANLVIALFIFLSIDTFDIQISYFFIFAVFNGIFSSILAIAFILISEIILNSPTIFRLQELADFSSPLLKKLFISAIGTYNHSIVVGNLAESAAVEIGANRLLAKVGGYYHDIGKLDNPEYFVENQSESNKHDAIKPTISVSIIKAHVKSGIERGRKARLPQKIIDIIAQHHGNTLIRYFYAEAVKNTSPEKEEIQRMQFQYQNQNPQFPESAIILLSDQVEAATRSLKKYTMTNIEKIIEKIMDDVFQEGVLDDSGLTLKDLTKIKKVFIKVVTGMYHPRIEYPRSNIDDKQKNGNKNSQANNVKK